MKKIVIHKVHLRKRSLQKVLTEYIFYLPLFLTILTDFLGLPGMLKYTIDIAWVGILALTLIHRYIHIKKTVLPMVYIVLAFFLCTLVVYGFQYQSIVYYFWGFRNNFRYYIAFFAFVSFLDENDVECKLNFLDVLFWVDVAVSAVQYAAFGYNQDHLGGIFGVERGSNACTLLLFSLVLTRSVLRMMSGEKRATACVLQMIAASIVSALAELKAFFVILVLILFLSAVMTKFSLKKCLLILVMLACISLGSIILVDVFGSSSTLSIDNISRMIFAKSYASDNDLGRLNAIPVLSKTILKDHAERWFGLGLGNCDTSAFAICNTPFYQAHSNLHYTWFSSAFLFLETGYVGLLLYASFFGTCLLQSVKQMREKGCNRLYCEIAVVFAVLCVVFMVYNASLRTDLGYIAYFALALPYAGKTRDEEKTS